MWEKKRGGILGKLILKDRKSINLGIKKVYLSPS